MDERVALTWPPDQVPHHQRFWRGARAGFAVLAVLAAVMVPIALTVHPAVVVAALAGVLLWAGLAWWSHRNAARAQAMFEHAQGGLIAVDATGLTVAGQVVPWRDVARVAVERFDPAPRHNPFNVASGPLRVGIQQSFADQGSPVGLRVTIHSTSAAARLRDGRERPAIAATGDAVTVVCHPLMVQGSTTAMEDALRTHAAAAGVAVS